MSFSLVAASRDYSLVAVHGLLIAVAGGSDSKESACGAGEQGLIPSLRISPGGGNGYPLQYSCPENPMDRGAW